ncbi:MvaI/BcnI family restriction endonuclease [Photobacterium sp. SDRW27]|uniref:MvaI/BcnI family restriction endonuclease n=1 Tax=Photobacterium obscurum TaxID=2829490 RepID=UPI002244DF18|nr:MvaI/BcnI family restriction endonuclease [Photobacterium obscurum]MCW8332037.1 MvaI/BcnI family restriction endonuclease [Photobacterium obscurum]
MTETHCYEHELSSIEEILNYFPEDRFTHVLAKPLPKNANDKNQVYFSSDFNMLGQHFAFRYGERGLVTSHKKGGKNAGKRIPEAVFEDFRWLTDAGEEIPAPNVKMLIYAQYPEMRLSGFKTETNEIPASMSVEYTKKNPEAQRIMILARTVNAGAVAMIVMPQGELAEEVRRCPGFMGSRVVRLLRETYSHDNDLRQKLSAVVEKWMPGVRRTKDNETIPFNGTQVCGYTLEDSLEIIPNSDKEGDYMGIELKAHTAKKVTLMTTEPDMGVYAEDFKRFMTDYGYKDEKSGAYRWTGTHKANMRSTRSGFTMRIEGYDRDKDISKQLVAGSLYIGMYAPDGTLAAGWSMERLLNGWGAKHNETVYVPAQRRDTENAELKDAGNKYEVRFNRSVVWCRGTSPKKLLDAILDGIIILDPAPKYDPNNPGKSKRRSQWRVNDISKAVQVLYDSVTYDDLLES